MRIRKLWPAVVVLGGLLGWAGRDVTRASAHATPHVLDIMFRPDGYLLLTNRGLIFGDATRTDWQLMCNEALGVNTSERPSLAYLPDGRLLAGTSNGLKVTADRGCSWTGLEPFAEVSAPALLADPADPKRIYLAIFDPEQVDKSGLYLSIDGGASWTLKLPAAANDYLRSIQAAPSDPSRLYATGQTWDDSGNYKYYVARSSDRGETWERVDLTLEANERELQLFAISPTDPSIVVGRANGSDPASVAERLMVSRDGGATFTSPLALKLLSAAAFSADGTRSWIVGQDGILESRDGLQTFTRIGKAESMSYAVERDGELLACGYYDGFVNGKNGIGVAPSASADGTFRSFLELSDVDAPLACDPTSPTAKTCASWWLDWEREVASGQFTGTTPGAAGSAAPAAGRVGGAAGTGSGSAGSGGAPLSGSAAPSAGSASAPTSPAADSGGCSTLPGDPSSTIPIAPALLVLLVLAARENRRRGTRVS